jgi:predicted Zn-dependent peptidase
MPIDYREAVLPNGLRVAAEVDPSAHTAAVGVFVRTGARDEPTELMGVSHFLEHMMFKGSASRSATDVNDAFNAIGADANAFTSSEMTAYHAHSLPEHLGRSASLVMDLLRPALRQEDFDEEKGVILEEIAMYDDNPFWVVYERAIEAYYRGHPLSHRVLGTPDSIRALTRDQMHGYFTSRYTPGSSIVVAAGRVDFDALVDLASRETESWSGHGQRRTAEPHRPDPYRFAHPMQKATRGYMLMMWPSVSSTDPQRYAASLCAHILGDSGGSRLHWSLVEPGIAEEADAGFDGRDGSGECIVSVACETEALGRVEDIVRRQCVGLAESITEDDLSRAKAKIATGVALGGERPAGRMRRLGGVLTVQGRYSSLEEEMATIEALTVRDLRAYLDAYPFDPVVVGQAMPAERRPKDAS